jgi:predicted metal-binding protein
MTSTKQREDYRSFYLKRSTWDAIRISRGWVGKGAASRFAETIGITRQYASEIINQRCGCSSNVMRKIIDLLGIKEGCWCHLFDRNCMVDFDPNHPIYNQEKYMGVIPYTKHSTAAEMRNLDYPVEKLNK